MSVNKAILLGRLGKDPELRYTPAGKAVTSFPLATTERWTGQDGQKNETTTWHNIVVWGRQAEVIKEYLSKGREVYLEGRISNRSYDDKDGNKRYISEVVVQNFSFVGSRAEVGEATTPDAGTSEVPPATDEQPPAGTAGDDDDLPF
ncbi:MAG: single-stranded DNA-binding protein [candidate division Zixibacteria bacterium]|nr:single-stranded DNA-binding protein [candidate division Zixibacteria bacterium]